MTQLYGDLLGFALTKNKNYMSLHLREYLLETMDAGMCRGIPDCLRPYKNEYAIKYSNLNLNRFYVGHFDYNVDEQNNIVDITFESHTGKNKWGWNFSTGENEHYAHLVLGKDDQIWKWKYGFAVVQYEECLCDRYYEIHQFLVLKKPPMGFTNNDGFQNYLGNF